MATDVTSRTVRRSASPPTDRVVAIMQLLGRTPQRLYSLTEIERTLDISRATAHAILSTLVGHRWIVRDHQSGHYSWGPAIAALARPAGATARLIQARLGELATAIDCQILLFRPQGEALVVIDAVGSTATSAPISIGFTVPLAAPFGREFIAYAPAEAQQAWLERVGPTEPGFTDRMTIVLGQVRDRGYAIERRSHAFNRVYAALHALSGEIDAITARLASAIADLTIVDYIGDELVDGQDHTVATVSAPVLAHSGAVPLTITAVVAKPLTAAAVSAIGSEIRRTAHDIDKLMTTYGDA